MLIHGEGGCGKTTLTRQIADGLPAGSVSIVFDCFGGGRCMYSDDKRHLPENAFLQISNEVALALGLPLFIPRSFKHPATIQTFLGKLRTAGEALKEQAPDAMLLITIDAADNSVAAAENADPKERPFVFDFVDAYLAKLPSNVRFLISARTSRLYTLRLRRGTPEVLCPPFDLQETKLHLAAAFPGVSDGFIEQFHSLSNANPRVQAYAIAAAGCDQNQTMAALLPGGKALADVLEKMFDDAFKKLGQQISFEKFIAALAYLPAPAAVSAMAAVSGLTEAATKDLALDLSPGLRLQSGAISIADEDFDSFVQARAEPVRLSMLEAIASHFMAQFKKDGYCATHLADALIAAGRAQDILSVIEQDPQVAAVIDPILRRQVQIRRLKLSLAACRHAGSTADGLKTILISAEAERDDSTLNEILEKDLDLSVEFGGASLRRTILLDPDRIEHGSFLAQDAVRAVRAGDRVTARENLYFHEAWLRRRNALSDEGQDNWKVTDFDVAARTETILELSGPKAAMQELKRWTSRSLPLRVADILVPELIVSGRIDRVQRLLSEVNLPKPWDLTVRVPMAMAGDPPDCKALEESLKQIRPRFIPEPDSWTGGHGEDGWHRRLLDTFVTACELGFLLGVDKSILTAAVSRILEVLRGKTPRQSFRSDYNRLDGILRSPKEEAPAPASRPRLVDNVELPMAFEFDAAAKTYTTIADIEAVLKAAATSGLRHSGREILSKMRAVTKPNDRVAFLDAVSAVQEDLARFTDRSQVITEALIQWKGSPSVERWRKESLPRAIAANFTGATHWLKEGNAVLHKLLDLSGADDAARVQIILEGISTSGLGLGSRTLFGTAEILASTLPPEEAATVLEWYATRLRTRLPQDHQQTLPIDDIPTRSAEAVGRFVFALMSDIDTRIRWKAAHVLRRLAQLGCADAVAATVAQIERSEDPAFRDPTGPFYFLAARMWLFLALYRISAEAPATLKEFSSTLLKTATSSDLPHVAIREYAKRAVAELANASVVSLSPQEQISLAAVNAPTKGTHKKDKSYGRSFHDRKDERFKFNSMDTLRYWYEDILRIFPTVSAEDVLKLAEAWIINRWKADPEANRWDKEPRKARYDERRFALWSNDHGSLPTLERWGTHLEWHAMHCVIGELLLTHSISDETGYGGFEYWLQHFLPTEPPQLLSDHRRATPLETRLWAKDPRTDDGWVRSFRRAEFRNELLSGAHYPGWIAVGAWYTSYFPKRVADVSISSALVSPQTATALLRALQSATDPHDFRIPDEDDDLQFDDPPYVLKGWLASFDGDLAFDDRDPFRYDVGRVRKKPSHTLISSLGLTCSGVTSWTVATTGVLALAYEAWSDESPRSEEYQSRSIHSNGWRLWARPEAVKTFLQIRQMDLICKVAIDRHLRKGRSPSYDANAKRKTAHKIYILKADGSIEDISGRIGSW